LLAQRQGAYRVRVDRQGAGPRRTRLDSSTTAALVYLKLAALGAMDGLGWSVAAAGREVALHVAWNKPRVAGLAVPAPAPIGRLHYPATTAYQSPIRGCTLPFCLVALRSWG
jgi:hypothetical protein